MKIMVRRGELKKTPWLEPGEPAFVTDNNGLYIGTPTGNIRLGQVATPEGNSWVDIVDVSDQIVTGGETHFDFETPAERIFVTRNGETLLPDTYTLDDTGFGFSNAFGISIGDTILAVRMAQSAIAPVRPPGLYLTWTVGTGTTAGYSSVCWSSSLGIFVAVCADGAIAYSSDGLSWTEKWYTTDNVPPGAWNSVCWAAELGLFAACSWDQGRPSIMTSSDGINWTARNTDALVGSLYSIAWSPERGRFVALTGYGYDEAGLTSTNGINWDLLNTDQPTGTNLVWGSGVSKFVCVQWCNTGTSANGLDWVVERWSLSDGFNSIAYSPDLRIFITLPYWRDYTRVGVSSDGISWQEYPIPIGDWAFSCWSPALGVFLTVAHRFSSTMYSFDGISWTIGPSPVVSLHGVCWSPELGIFVAVGDEMAMATGVVVR